MRTRSSVRRFLALATLSMLASACGSPLPSWEPNASSDRLSAASSSAQRQDVEAVIAAGMKYLKVPYRWGSDRKDKSEMDCSELVRWAFLEGASLELPSNSRTQAAYVREQGPVKTDWRQLQRGDLMFFMSFKGSKPSDYAQIDRQAERITHVGIYLGEGKILHTYSLKSGGVRVDSFPDTPWEYRFMMGGSALSPVIVNSKRRR